MAGQPRAFPNPEQKVPKRVQCYPLVLKKGGSDEF